MWLTASRWVSWTTCVYVFIGDGDLAVSEDLHHDAWSDPGRREKRGAAVPGIVQSDHAKATLSR
jgi:hypothetical protein